MRDPRGPSHACSLLASHTEALPCFARRSKKAKDSWDDVEATPQVSRWDATPGAAGMDATPSRCALPPAPFDFLSLPLLPAPTSSAKGVMINAARVLMCRSWDATPGRAMDAPTPRRNRWDETPTVLP